MNKEELGHEGRQGEKEGEQGKLGSKAKNTKKHHHPLLLPLPM